jgi:hypothetical protein
MSVNFTNRPSRFGDNWWRPTTAEYYVFLNTLKDDDPYLYDLAKQSTDLMGEQNKAEVELQLQNALNFLHKMIVNERVKENNFLFAHKDELGGLGEYDFTMDGMELIKKINYAIQGVDLTDSIVKLEKTRMAGLNTRATGQTINVPWSVSQAFQSYARTLINTITGQGNGNAGFGKRNADIAEIIMQHIDQDFIKNGKSITNIDSQTLFTSIFTLQLSALEILNGAPNYTFNDMMESPAFATMYDNLINAYTIAGQSQQKFVETMEQQFKDLGFTKGTDPTTKKIKADIAWLTKEGRANLEKTKDKDKIRKNFSNDLEQALKNMKDFALDVSITQKKGIGAEVISNAIQGALGTVVANGTYRKSYATGATGTATDTLSFEVDIRSNSAGEVDKIIKDMIQKDLKVKHEDFYRQNDSIRVKYEQLEKLLAQKRLEYSELDKCFILHSNVKDYATIGGKGAKTQSFKGGEWGVAPFMSYLRSLAELGFAPQDLDLIQFAILNTAPGAVLNKNKSPIESFISVFLALTLFSDGITMANEIAMGLTANQTTLNSLHLFYVNHLYVPASYVLETVYNEMTKEKRVTDKGVKAHIIGGIAEPKEVLDALTQDRVWGRTRWNEFRQAELETVKIRIQFLGDFFNIINSF